MEFEIEKKVQGNISNQPIKDDEHKHLDKAKTAQGNAIYCNVNGRSMGQIGSP